MGQWPELKRNEHNDMDVCVCAFILKQKEKCRAERSDGIRSSTSGDYEGRLRSHRHFECKDDDGWMKHCTTA